MGGEPCTITSPKMSPVPVAPVADAIPPSAMRLAIVSRQLPKERDENIAGCGGHRHLWRRTGCRRLAKRIWPKPAIDRIEGIVDREMHHGVEP